MKNYIYLILALPLVGCTTYPKQYTYSPTVTINGSNNEAVNLPSPFAKGFPKTVNTQRELPPPQYTYADNTPHNAPSRYLYNPTTGELYDTQDTVDFTF